MGLGLLGFLITDKHGVEGVVEHRPLVFSASDQGRGENTTTSKISYVCKV